MVNLSMSGSRLARTSLAAVVVVVSAGLFDSGLSSTAGASPPASLAVYSWGDPAIDAGGTPANGEVTGTPTLVSGIPDPIVQIATSNSDTYALDARGAVWAWGMASQGELGNGTEGGYTSTPVQVQFPAGVAIAFLPDPMPYDTALAIDTSGHVWGWGFNNQSELCTTSRTILTPVELSVSDVALASGAAGHVLYDSNGTVYACGDNKDGELGDGSILSSNTPVPVRGLPSGPVQSLVTSELNSGVLMAGGAYYNWGYDAAGELGDDSTTMSALPVRVPLQAPVTDVSEGGSDQSNGQTLAILSDGSVWAWGNGSDGQLGDGSMTNSLVPVQVHVPSNVVFTQVISGGSTSFAIDSKSTAWSWGDDSGGELGVGTLGSKYDTATPMSLRLLMLEISSTADNVTGREPPPL